MSPSRRLEGTGTMDVWGDSIWRLLGDFGIELINVIGPARSNHGGPAVRIRRDWFASRQGREHCFTAASRSGPTSGYGTDERIRWVGGKMRS